MPSLAEAISCLQKATSCRGCGRLPSSSETSRAHHDDSQCNELAGALFVSSNCGDMFCAACWEKSMPNCPICHCRTAPPPKPIIATLAADSKANAFEKLDLSDMSKIKCNLGELSSLFDILRNLTSTTKSGAVYKSDSKSDSNICHDGSFEEEVPGTFQEFCPRDTGEKSTKSGTPSASVLASQASSIHTANDMGKQQYQCTPQTGIKSEILETPTVRESQVTSVHTNNISILNSVDRSESHEETQTIPGTYFTPLHTFRSNKSKSNAQLHYFIDNIGKVDSPLASSTASKPNCDLSSSSDESVVEGTCLSSFKMSCEKKADKQDDDNSTSEEEFHTEPWERQIDLAAVDKKAETLEPVAKRRCVSTSPNESTKDISLQQELGAAKNSKIGKCTAPGMQLSSPTKHLYLSYDVLNEEECEALSFLCNGKLGVRIISDILPVSRGGNLCPLPTILITHAIEKPRFGKGTPTRYNAIATCHRTYSYMKAVALGARCVDAQWLKDCQTSGSLLCCDSYSIYSDLESYNALIASGSKIEGVTIRGTVPFNKISPLNGTVFGFIDTLTKDAKLPSFKSLTSVQISSLVECWGGNVSNDSFTLMHALLARDCATLHQIVQKLKTCLQDNRDVSKESWSIESCTDEELDALINNDGTMNNSYSDDYRVPIIRAKWVENSICMNSLQSLKDYCIGVLCFEFDMGSNVDERQTLLC
eukprot:scaffold1766_cov142-Skeletonema_menzelii.AAC.2